MFECHIQLFGFPKEIIDGNEVILSLDDDASLADVVAQLRKKVPALEGFAVAPGENRLVAGFKFNLNGRLIYTDYSMKVQGSDRIALLPRVSGG